MASQYLVTYYERFGFENRGPSQAAYGGGGWYNMVHTFHIPLKVFLKIYQELVEAFAEAS